MKPIQQAYVHGAAQATQDFDKTAGHLPIKSLLAGGALGAGTGAVAAGEGNRLEGALRGGALGAVGGTAGASMPAQLRELSFLLGSAGGGALGGLASGTKEGSLGDPNFWAPEEAAMGAEGSGGAPAATAEDAAMSLPAGTFQGLQLKVNPTGERNTTVKVTPDALGTPDALAGIFQAEPAAKIEVAMPQQSEGGQGGGAPGDPSGMGLPEEAPLDGVGALPPGVAGKVATLANRYRR